MKKTMVILCSVLMVLLLAACGNKVDDATADKYIEKATEVVNWLNEEEFEKITAQFDETMKANLTEAQLAEISPIIEASGAFEEIQKQSVEEKDGMKVVVLVAKHKEEKRIYTISYDGEDKIAGLFVK